jgi:hypothetical protein
MEMEVTETVQWLHSLLVKAAGSSI